MALKLNNELGIKKKDKIESYLFLDEGETAKEYISRMTAAIKKHLKDVSIDTMVIEFQTLLDASDFDMEDKSLRKCIDELISAVKEGVKTAPIYVIKTYIPECYETRGTISANPNYAEETEKVSSVNLLEAYFASETGAVLINSTEDYIYKKRSGYKLNYWTYEDECYKALSKEIKSGIKTERHAPEVIENRERFTGIGRAASSWYITDLYDLVKELLDSGKMDDESLAEKCDAFAEDLKKKYQENHIVLLDMKNLEIRLGDDNVIYKNPAKDMPEIEKLSDNALIVLKEKLSCYSIEISGLFIPEYRDDERPEYGAEYEKEVTRIVKYLISKKPLNKVIDKVDGSVRAGYLLKLRVFNSDSLLQTIYDTPLDKIVLSLPSYVMRRNIKTVAKWYQKDFSTREEISDSLSFTLNKELKKYIGNAAADELLIIPELPECYIDEPWLGHVREYKDPVPVAPQPYMIGEVEDTIEKVNSLITPDSLAFVLVTDIHYKSVNKKSKKPTDITYQRMLANMKAVLDKTYVSFVLNLGDDTDGNYIDMYDLRMVSKYVTEGLLGLNKPYYRVLGNHDTNHYAKKLLDVETMRKYYLDYLDRYDNLVFNPDSDGTEYYLDIPEKNIRMIVLNTQYGEIFAYSASTGRWLNEVALDTDYTILLAEHLSCITTMNMNASPIKNRETVKRALKDHKRSPIIQLCGHSHCDYSFTDGDPKYSPWLTVFCNLQRCTRRRQYDIGDITVGHTGGKFGCPHRTGETLSEDCWEVVVINPSKRKINLVRFGAGEDREFSY